MAGAIWRVKDLVVEYREVESESKTDWVGGSELGLGDIGGILLDVNLRGVQYSMRHTLYASWAAVAATLRFSPDANSAR